MPSRGHFVCIEGGEGVGKTFIASELGARLRRQGDQVFVAKDPGDTKLAGQLRNICIDRRTPCEPLQQILLYTAARSSLAQRLEHILADGIHVVCARWALTTFVYQERLGELPPGITRQLSRLFCPLEPDLTLILDCDPEIALQRKRRQLGEQAYQGNRFDSRPLEWHASVRSHYQSVVGPRRILIDASQPATDVIHQCQEAINLSPDVPRLVFCSPQPESPDPLTDGESFA